MPSIAPGIISSKRRPNASMSSQPCRRAAAEAQRPLRRRSGRVLLLVPLDGAYLGEEILHRRFVAGEQLAVEVARIPVDQHAAEIEDDDAAAWRRVRHGALSQAATGARCVRLPITRRRSSTDLHRVSGAVECADRGGNREHGLEIEVGQTVGDHSDLHGDVSGLSRGGFGVAWENETVPYCEPDGRPAGRATSLMLVNFILFRIGGFACLLGAVGGPVAYWGGVNDAPASPRAFGSPR